MISKLNIPIYLGISLINFSVFFVYTNQNLGAIPIFLCVILNQYSLFALMLEITKDPTKQDKRRLAYFAIGKFGTIGVLIYIFRENKDILLESAVTYFVQTIVLSVALKKPKNT